MGPGTLWRISAGVVLVAGAVALQETDDSPAAPDAGPVGTSGPSTAGAIQPPAPSVTPLDVPKDRFAEIRDRTLFHPSRRQLAAVQAAPPHAAVPAPAPAPATPEPPPLQGYTLVGIAISDSARVALLRFNSQTLNLTQGGQLLGWTAAEITETSVLFRAEGRTFTLALPSPIPGATIRTLTPPSAGGQNNPCAEETRACRPM